MTAGRRSAGRIVLDGIGELVRRVPALHPIVGAYWRVSDAIADRSEQRALPERRFRQSLRRWLRDLDGSAPLPRPLPERRVLVFSFLMRWIEMCSAIAVVLAKRGCDVDVVFLPQYWNRRVGRTDRWEDRISERHVWGPLRSVRHPRLRFVPLTDLPGGPPDPQISDEMVAQSIVDVMYIRRRETVDADGSDAPLLAEREARDVDAAGRLAAFMRSRRHDSALVANGVMLETGAAYRTARALGIDTVTFEGWDRPKRIVVGRNELWTSLDIRDAWSADAPHHLGEERRGRVQAFLDARARPRDDSDYLFQYQSAGTRSIDDLRSDLRIAPGRTVVLVCTNVFWDSLFLASGGRIFPSMRDWLTGTIRALAGRTDVHVVLQPHPGEGFARSAESAAAIVGPLIEGCANVSVLEPRRFNTYSLMAVADAGAVYASTTGLEMAMRGLPVVCGNAYHYTGHGFTIDPNDRDGYFRALDGVVRDPRAFSPSVRQVEVAWCYADVFFSSVGRDFPWTLSRFRNDEELDAAYPMREVLSAEGQARYGAVFDLLGGR